MEDKGERFLRANQDISAFLRRVERLSEGTCWIDERDLQALSDRVAGLGPELRNASEGANPDLQLQEEVAKYIAHLRALQTALEKVQCIMLTRKARLDADRQHLNGLQGWLCAYHQTA